MNSIEFLREPLTTLLFSQIFFKYQEYLTNSHKREIQARQSRCGMISNPPSLRSSFVESGECERGIRDVSRKI